MQQDVGTIHPVDMDDHGVKAMGGHIFKTEMLLDTFMKKLHGPAQPVPHDNLACCGPQVIAGEILAATIRSIALFRTHQLNLAHVAQVARGVSDAKVHSLAFVPIRPQTNGVPLEPAMTAEKRVHMQPILRFGAAQIERGRFDTAGFAQGDDKVPALLGNGLFDLFVVVAAVGQHHDLAPIVSAQIRLEVECLEVVHHAFMLAVIREALCLAVALAVEGNRLEGDQDVAQDEDDVGPLMADDVALAVVERFGVFRMQTGAVLHSSVDDQQDLPGQTTDALERLGDLSGLRFGELLEGADGHVGMRFQEFGKQRGMESRESGGFLERMLAGGNQQKEQISGANAPQALPDGDVAFGPGVQGASGHAPLPAMSHPIEMETMTLRGGTEGVQVPWWVAPGRIGSGVTSRSQPIVS